MTLGPIVVFWALLAIALFGIVARMTRVPYPIVMVIGGALLALIPNVPPLHLPPDIVFVLLLPPMLFSGGWATDARALKRFLEPILLLAFGLVAFTTIVVAFVAHAYVGLPLASAFVLGAILSPPDAIATEAIGESVAFPREIATILSGESLINDASALVIYRFAVAAVATGAFSLASATLDVVYVSVAGVAIGLAVAEIAARIQIFLRKRNLVDDVTATIVTLVTPFLAYLPAEAAHASGVLAAVAGGISLSRYSDRMFDGQMRLTASGAWATLIFTLNGIAFLSIGLQLDSVIAGLHAYRPMTLALYALAICGVVVVSRFVWIFASVYGRRALGRFSETEGRKVTWRGLTVMSWAGMRGIVTLAGALALPNSMMSGAAFPDRNLIVFLAFTTILVTLVGQGLTLPFLMRALDVVEDGDNRVTEIARARVSVALAARARLRQLETEFTTQEEWTIASRIIAGLDQRIEHFGDGPTPTIGTEDVATQDRDRAIQRDLTMTQRETLSALRDRGEITDHAYREVQWEIDLFDLHLG